MKLQMIRVGFYRLSVLLLFPTLLACEQINEDFPDNQVNSQDHVHETELSQAIDYREVEWTDLMPASDLDALLNPPSYVTDVEDGSLDDVISSQLQNQPATDPNDPYQQALVSTKIVEAMNNQSIRIPGFIVPLEYNKDSKIIEFFLVPFFGACIHVPPPPPNQIIYVQSEEGVEQKQLYDAYWISGKISTTLIENDMATAAYSMQLDEYKPYYDDYELPEDNL